MSSDQRARRFFPDSTHAQVAAGIPKRAEEDKRGWPAFVLSKCRASRMNKVKSKRKKRAHA